MGSGEIILHRLLRHINTGKIQPLSAQSRNRYDAGTEDNDQSENIRGEGRFHSHTLQFFPLNSFLSASRCVLICSDLVYCLFPNTPFPIQHLETDEDGHGRTTRWAICLSPCLHFTHTCEFTSGNEITLTQQRDADFSSEGLLDCVQRLVSVCYGKRPSCQTAI
ncbi:hypothetical protein DPX16_6913 [Anabarilius grahami]|uniref:Uncharacterized protein n=1 Tax=Anabarilius grahami TaxID=495550 RepID=A0A3N0Y5N5_ANAGA|nr:hypothetical protein DPX16_6913 [Anabarilius grahami]